MIDFTKPLLTDEVPEPPILGQKQKEEAQQRARQSLAGIPGAARAAEDAGLVEKPAPPVRQLQDIKLHGAKAAAAQKPASVPEKAGAKEIKKKNPAKKLPKPEKAETSAPLSTDHDLQLRKSALQTVLASMQSHPDAEVVSSLFALFVAAPGREAAAAALVLSMNFLRSPAKARAPLMKAFAPALRQYRGSKLAVLLADRLGHVVAAKPPAPVAPPPGG